MSSHQPRIMQHEGQIFEIIGIFSGDGKLYDELRESHNPIRLGSLMLRPVELEVPTDVAEIDQIPDTRSEYV